MCPVAVHQHAANPQFGQENAGLELITTDTETSAQVLARIRELMREHSVLRGQVISFASEDFGGKPAGANFQERPQVRAEDVILPAGVLVRCSVAPVIRPDQDSRSAGHGALLAW